MRRRMRREGGEREKNKSRVIVFADCVNKYVRRWEKGRKQNLSAQDGDDAMRLTKEIKIPRTKV
jgi:hypothetical protein